MRGRPPPPPVAIICTSPTGFESVLAEFKGGEIDEDIIPILSDGNVQKCIIAWPKVVITRVPSNVVTPNCPNEKWGWLWAQVAFSDQQLEEISGIPGPRLTRALNQAKGNRLLYPDGTVAKHAKRYLRNIALTATTRLKME